MGTTRLPADSGVRAHPLSRRALIGALATTSAAGLLAACSGASSPSSSPAAGRPADQPVEVRVATWAGPEEQKQLQGLLDAFMQATPRIKAVLEPAPDQYQTKMLSLFSAGSGPDALWLQPTDVLSFAKKNVLLALDPFRKSHPADTGQIYPELLTYFTLDGKLYALPKDWFPADVLYVNKTLLQQLNLKWPAPTWTWPDFLTTLHALTHDDGTRIDRFGYSCGTSYFWWEYWARSNGGDVFDNPLTPMKFTLGQEPAAAGLQFFADLWLKERVAVNPTTASQDLGGSMEQAFVTQRVAIGTWGTWVIATVPFKAIKDFQWDIALPPVAPGAKPANVLVANAYALGRDSKVPDAAWELVAFVAGSKRGQALNSQSGLAVPTIPAVANSPDFKNPNLPIQWDVFLKPADYARWGPRHVSWPDISQVLSPALSSIWRGEKRAVEAMREVEPQVNDLLKKS